MVSRCYLVTFCFAQWNELLGQSSLRWQRRPEVGRHVEAAAFPRRVGSPKRRGRAIKRQTSHAASCSNTPHAAVAWQRGASSRPKDRRPVSTAAVVQETNGGDTTSRVRC